jgi:hypothetical protein
MRVLIRTTLVVVLVVAAGCSESEADVKRSNITGTVTRDGKPLEWPFEGGKLHVIFVPEDRKPNQYPFRGEADRATGTYTLPPLPPGKYLVAVHMFDDRHMDALKNKFDPAHSPLRAEVTEDGQVINIDIPKDLPKDEPKAKGAPKGPPPK